MYDLGFPMRAIRRDLSILIRAIGPAHIANSLIHDIKSALMNEQYQFNYIEYTDREHKARKPLFGMESDKVLVFDAFAILDNYEADLIHRFQNNLMTILIVRQNVFMRSEALANRLVQFNADDLIFIRA